MRYDTPYTQTYDFGFGAPPVTFGNQVYGYVGSAPPQSMTMNGSIYAPLGSYMGAYSVVMQQDAFRASLTANGAQIFGGANANFTLANSHVDTFVPTLSQAPAQGSGDNGQQAAANGQQSGRYTYVVANDGTITYKKPDGTNCGVTEFRQQAGEQAYREAQAARQAAQQRQS